LPWRRWCRAIVVADRQRKAGGGTEDGVARPTERNHHRFVGLVAVVVAERRDELAVGLERKRINLWRRGRDW